MKMVTKKTLNLNNNCFLIIIMVENISKILEKIFQTEKSLIITLPENVNWLDYEKEFKKTANYKHCLNFKVHNFPRGIHKGDKCYVVYKDVIQGWMEIVDFSKETHTCSQTNKQWDSKYIQRSGPFHYLNEKIPYKGFQGFRYFDLNEYKLQNNIK